MNSEREYRIEMKAMSKSFGGIHALKNVSFSVKPGEIHCLVGENGAGKSTLMKILSGAYRMDSGSIKVDGEDVKITSPLHAIQLGIGIVYQEFELADELSVAENIFLESLRKKSIINWKKLYADADEIVREIGFEIDTSIRTGSLSVAYKQIVEISKVISKNIKILILDEPTAVLNDKEAEVLFGLLRRLRERDVSIIYISHRLEEVFKIGDTITTLRDGEITGVNPVKEMTIERIIELMIGRKLADIYPKRDVVIGEEGLRVEGFSNGNVYQDISFTARKGEVLGISGLVGSGRTEVARAIFGADRRRSGNVYLDGKMVNLNSTVKAVRSSVALIPENRKEQGLVPDLNIKQNITITDMGKVTNSFGVISDKKEVSIATKLAGMLKIKAESVETSVFSLSGGNQQKVVISKWFNTEAKVIIMDEPTRGVDVGAKSEIYRLINELAAEGNVVIFISSEMMELMGMCDRLLVMSEGRIKGELSKEKFSEKNIMQLILGGQ
ncbi:MAG: sugar ABC transporter ATP-binding protein [Oscillospiraceae bacterium]|nr:sugar ABC transporter ATP-binding protein [Oscillospiraceae bacterium]